MIAALALKNLIYDRARLAITIIGTIVSVVLVAGQLGLYSGSSKLITDPISAANADLWIMARSTPSFEEGRPLDTGRERQLVMPVAGVTSVTELFVAFADWTKPQGGSMNVLVIGSAPDDGGFAPWNLEPNQPGAIDVPGTITVDRRYAADLGIERLGEKAQIESTAVRIGRFTRNIGSFTQTPLVFIPLRQARNIFDASSDTATYLLVKLAPGTDVASAKASIQERVQDADVLTPEEFKDRSLETWLFNTGAGIALIGGAVLGIIVGTVIVSQTLYSSIKDNVREYATLRAIGASSGYLKGVVIIQALVSTTAGYVIGMSIVLLLARLSEGTSLPLTISWWLCAVVLALCLAMAAIAAVAAIRKVLRIDPAAVFAA